MLACGIDVGGTNFRVGVFSGKELAWEKRFEADFSLLCKKSGDARNSIMETMASAISEAVLGYPAIRGIGIGFPGFIDPETMYISSSPNLPGLHDVDIAGPLSQRFDLPVIVENDALSAAYGEKVLGGQESLIYIGLGTGVGGGLILKGKPYPGEHGVAMEIGHIIVEPGGRACGCGNHGCLERYASASGVSISYLERTGKALSAREIAALADAGDESAVSAFVLAGDRLGFALSHIMKVVDVAHVVIGGGLSEAWDRLEESFRERLEADLIPVLRGKCEIGVSKAKDQAGMLGAAMLASIHF